MRVHSDKFHKMKKHIEEMGMGMMGEKMVPVDLYNKQVYFNKQDPDAMKKAAKEVQEAYDLME